MGASTQHALHGPVITGAISKGTYWSDYCAMLDCRAGKGSSLANWRIGEREGEGDVDEALERARGGSASDKLKF